MVQQLKHSNQYSKHGLSMGFSNEALPSPGELTLFLTEETVTPNHCTFPPPTAPTAPGEVQLRKLAGAQT